VVIRDYKVFSSKLLNLRELTVSQLSRLGIKTPLRQKQYSFAQFLHEISGLRLSLLF